MCCWQIITFSNDPAGSLATSLLKSSNDKLMSAWYASNIVAIWSSVNLSTARGSRCCAWKRFSDLREYDTVGIADWFFHENSWFGQFRHALSKYAKKNIPSWFSFRDIYDRISTIFRQILKIRIFIAVKRISQFQNGER